MAEVFGCRPEALLPCSAKTGAGLPAVWQAIDAMVTLST
jgi:hypothetical protein